MATQFPKRLKELRLNKGLTQLELSIKVGATKQNISDWENGKSETSYEILARLASFFNVTIGQLVGTEDLQI